ncbi:murein biosynthesis integral membrane protein MurJ [Priestia megaterium]
MGKSPVSFLAKTTLIVGILTLIVKFLGFLREVLIGYAYGTSYTADAIILALTFPTIIFAAFQSAIGTAYVPVYAKESNQSETQAIRFTNNVLTILMFTSIVIIIILLFFNGRIVTYLSQNVNLKSLKLTTELTYIVIPSLLFSNVSVVLTNYLQCQGAFKQALTASFPQYILVILSFVFVEKFSIHIIVEMFFLGSIVQMVLLFLISKRYGYYYKFTLDFKNKNLQSMYILLVPITIGIGVQQINTIVDRVLAASTGAGGVAALNYASKLNGFVFGIVSYAIVTVIFPLMSKFRNENKSQADLIEKSISLTNTILIPLILFTMMFNKNIVSILFERGSFGEQDVKYTSSILLYYTIGMLFFSYRDILVRTFYSMEETKIPLVSGIVTVILNIIFGLMLIKPMGVNGIALATSISIGLTTVVLFYNLYKIIKDINFMRILLNFIQSLISTLIAIVVIYFVRQSNYILLIDMEKYNFIISFILVFFIYTMVYFFILTLMKKVLKES